MRFDLQPHLQGEFISIRPLKADDWHDLFAAASDPLIWAQHPARDRWQEDAFRRFFEEALIEIESRGGAFAVIDKATGMIVGSTRFHGWSPERSEVEIGWTFLARSHWGGRYNHEMKRLMLAHAFSFVECVIFLVGEFNIRSQTAVERIGGIRSGFIDNVDFGGVQSRSIKYVIRRPA